jgi:hypothetical protein
MPDQPEVAVALRTAMKMAGVSDDAINDLRNEICRLADIASSGRRPPAHRVLDMDGGTSWPLTFRGHRGLDEGDGGFRFTDDGLVVAYVPAGQAWRIRMPVDGDRREDPASDVRARIVDAATGIDIQLDEGGTVRIGTLTLPSGAIRHVLVVTGQPAAEQHLAVLTRGDCKAIADALLGAFVPAEAEERTG